MSSLKISKLKSSAAAAAFFLTLGGASAAFASDNNAVMAHVSVSVNDPFSIAEVAPVKFGNFVVGGVIGGADANIVMTDVGARTANNGASTTITLLRGVSNGVAALDDAGAQQPGIYSVAGATATTNVYITFAEPGMPAALIDSSHPANHATLTGPGGDTFTVDTFTFNSTGSDAFGPYILSDGSGNAMVDVGATLHTTATATTYADGAYRGTMDVMASY